MDTLISGIFKGHSILKNINQLLKTIIIYKLANKPLQNDFFKTCIRTLLDSLTKILFLSINIDLTKIIKDGISIEKISLSFATFIKRLAKLEKNVDIKNFFYLMNNLIQLNKLKKIYNEKHKQLSTIEENIKKKRELLKKKNLVDMLTSPKEMLQETLQYDKLLGEKRQILKNKSPKTYFNELIEGPLNNNFFFNFIKEILEEIANHYLEGKAFNSLKQNGEKAALKLLKHVIKDLTENPNQYMEKILVIIFTSEEFLSNRPSIGNNILELFGMDYKILQEIGMEEPDKEKDSKSNIKQSKTAQEILTTVNFLSEYFITRKKFSLTVEKEKNPQRTIINKLNQKANNKKEKIYLNQKLYLDLEELIEFGATKILGGMAKEKIEVSSDNEKLIKKFLETLIEETHKKFKKDLLIEEIENAEKQIQKALGLKLDTTHYKIAQAELATLKNKMQSEEGPLFSSIALAGIYTMLTGWISRATGNKLSFLIDFLSQFGIENFQKTEEETDIVLTKISEIGKNSLEEREENILANRMIREA